MIINFIVQRQTALSDCTPGQLWLDGDTEKFQAFTLEPLNPMPAGKFPAPLRYSPGHGYAVPGFLNVPGHTDIEMHPGNWPRNTKDCVLPGDSHEQAVDEIKDGGDGLLHNMVTNSRATFEMLMTLIGVPNYRDLTSWDLVRQFLLDNPDAGRCTFEIRDAA